MKRRLTMLAAAVLLLLMLPLRTAAQTTALGSRTLDANGEYLPVAVANQNVAAFTFALSGTWSGTVTFGESATSDCSSLTTIPVFNASLSLVTSATGNGSFLVPNSGHRWVCAKIVSGWSSGSVTVTATRGFVPPGGGGGGSGGTLTSDGDDGSIAGAQTNSNVNALTMAFDGSVWRRLTFGTAGTASSQVWTVQGIASMTPLATNVTQIGGATQSATNPLSVRITNGTSFQADDVAENVAHSGNPVPIGGITNATPSSMTLLTDARRSMTGHDLDRALVTRPQAPIGDWTNSGEIDVSSGNSTQALAAAASGIKHVVTSVICNNPSATDVVLYIRDGNGGTIKAAIPCPAGGAIFNPPIVPINGFTAATRVDADLSAAATGATVTLLGYKSKL